MHRKKRISLKSFSAQQKKEKEKERRDRKHDLLMWSEMHKIYCSQHNRGVTENFANFKCREQQTEYNNRKE